MRRLAALGLLVAVVAGMLGFAAGGSEQASAQPISLNDRFDIDCEVGPVVDGKGTVTCTLTVDLPDPLEDVSLTLTASYEDRDGSGSPSPGDRLQCVSVQGTLPNGTVVDVTRCRPGVPPPVSPP